LTVPEDSTEPYLKLNWPQTPKLVDKGNNGGGGYGSQYTEGYCGQSHPNATYAGMISRMDRDIGRIRALLDELHVAENTLLVFSSDNGPCTAGGQDIDFFRSRGGLRGEKRTLYEGGVRVPTIAWWPGTIEPGAESDHASVFYDWLPTFAELAGTRPDGPTDGVSLAPLLQARSDQQREHDYIFWDYGESGVTSRISAVRKGKWKLVVNRQKSPDRPELYDLSVDVTEQQNLADEHPEVVDELLPIMKQWWR